MIEMRRGRSPTIPQHLDLVSGLQRFRLQSQKLSLLAGAGGVAGLSRGRGLIDPEDLFPRNLVLTIQQPDVIIGRLELCDQVPFDLFESRGSHLGFGDCDAVPRGELAGKRQ